MEISNKTIVIVDPKYFIIDNIIPIMPQCTIEPEPGLREYEVYNENGCLLGEYTTNGGTIGVYYLDDVLAYNPDFEKVRQSMPWVATVIYNFTGVVYVVKNKIPSYPIQIFGTGTTNFYSQVMNNETV